MAGSTSRLSYQDCYELFDKAMESERGTKVKVESRDAAVHLKSRLNYSRTCDRKDNVRVYEEGHPLYGRSVYDQIMVGVRRDKQGQHWVVLRKIDKIRYETQNIGDEDGFLQGSASDNREAEGKEEDPSTPFWEKEERRA